MGNSYGMVKGLVVVNVGGKRKGRNKRKRELGTGTSEQRGRE